MSRIDLYPAAAAATGAELVPVWQSGHVRSMSVAQINGDVKSFGAKGDGTTDDTAAFNAALAALPTGGGLLSVPGGTYLISSTINVTGASIHIQGSGTHSTRIMQTSASQGVFNVTGTDCQIDNMLLGYTGVTAGPSTVALDTASANGRHSNLTIYSVANGIRVSGEGTAQFFQNINVQGATVSCFWADNTSDTQISNFIFLPGGADGAGANLATGGAFRVSGWVEGLVARSGEIYGGLHSLSMAGTALARGSCPAFCNFTDVYFDSSYSYSLLLTNVMDVEFVGCWVAGGRVAGLGAAGCWLTSTSGIRFTSSKFIANGSHGLALNAGAVNTTVIGCTFDSNGANVSAGTAAGIVAVADVSKFTVLGCRFSNGIIAPPTGGVQQYGVSVLTGGSNHYRIEGNIFDASLGGAGVFDNGTGTDKQVETGIGNRGALTAASVAASGGIGVFGHAVPGAQPTVTGSRSGGAGLASLLTALAATGLIVDGTTA